MIYQTLITARWKPHLLSWCMVMIALRHRLPWILTNALLSSLLVSSPLPRIPLSPSVYLLYVLSYPPWLCFASPQLSLAVFSSVSSSLLHAPSLHRFFPFLFYLWLLFPLLSYSITASFNPLWYWEVGHLLFRLIPPVCPVLKWKALMLPGTTLECSQTLNITVTGLSQPDMDTPHQPAHTSAPWPLNKVTLLHWE